MLPLRDTIPSKNYPVVNNTLIGINCVIFIFQLMQGSYLGEFNYTYGLVPARYTHHEISTYFSSFEQVFSFISFMFLHGGVWHLLGNMWSLYIFGDNVEDHLGSLRYLGFYLLCGFLSGISHLFLNLNSTAPVIGASGAIAGVMGAYLMLYPRAKILTLFPVFFIPLFFEIYAFLYLGLWFFIQFVNATSASGSSIAWWAHIGGFLSGIILLKLYGMMPVYGLSERVQKYTTKKSTEKFQTVHIAGNHEDLNLYGELEISDFECNRGCRKYINFPWGFYKRLYTVNIPEGVRSGQQIRLKGQGKKGVSGETGDIYLKVRVV